MCKKAFSSLLKWNKLFKKRIKRLLIMKGKILTNFGPKIEYIHEIVEDIFLDKK